MKYIFYICELYCVRTQLSVILCKPKLNNQHTMNTKLFNQDLAKDYISPNARTFHILTEGVLCGSYNGAQIPGYGDEDVWADD